MQKRLFAHVICYVVLLVVIAFGTKSRTYIEAATTNVHLFGIHDPDGADRWSWMDNFVGRFKTHTDSVKVKKYNYFSAGSLYNSLKNKIFTATCLLFRYMSRSKSGKLYISAGGKMCNWFY